MTDSYWDVPATGQSTSAGGATGFGTPADASPVENMTGTDATTNMTRFDFESTWATVTEPDGYPILAWEAAGEQTAALEIGSLTSELTNETEGHDYATAEIPTEETAGVETEGLTVTLTITGDDEGVVFEETVERSELQGEARSVAFDVGTIDAADVYAATVTVEANNAPEATATHVFEVQSETSGGGGDSGSTGGGGDGADNVATTPTETATDTETPSSTDSSPEFNTVTPTAMAPDTGADTSPESPTEGGGTPEPDDEGGDLGPIVPVVLIVGLVGGITLAVWTWRQR